MNVLLDPTLPRHWVSRIEACARMATASGIRYGLVSASPGTDLVQQGLRRWPAVVIQSLSPRIGDAGNLSGAEIPKPGAVPVVGYVRQVDVALVARALHEGRRLQGLLIEDVSDKPWDVLEALQCAQRHTLPAHLQEDLAQLAGERLGQLSIQVLMDGRRITVSLLTELYGKSPRTLRRHFAARGLPRPERWAGWLTTIAASAYLAASRRTIDSVGFVLGFDSGAALSQTCRRLTGSGLSAFRGPNDYNALLDYLRSECAEEKKRSRRSRADEDRAEFGVDAGDLAVAMPSGIRGPQC